MLRVISSILFFRGGFFIGVVLKYVKKILFISLLNGKRKVFFVIMYGKFNDDVVILVVILCCVGVVIISIGVGWVVNYV